MLIYIYNIYIYIYIYIKTFENKKGGGILYISKRYIKANSKYMSSYDKNEDLKYIIYEDTVNL